MVDGNYLKSFFFYIFGVRLGLSLSCLFVVYQIKRKTKPPQELELLPSFDHDFELDGPGRGEGRVGGSKKGHQELLFIARSKIKHELKKGSPEELLKKFIYIKRNFFFQGKNPRIANQTVVEFFISNDVPSMVPSHSSIFKHQAVGAWCFFLSA